LLRDHDESARRAAALALSTIGIESVPALIDVLSSHDERAQQLAAAALGRIRDIRAVSPLLDTIIRNREASAQYPEPLEAARAARDALIAILTVSAGSIPQAELDSIAGAPDGACAHQHSDDDQTIRWDVVVDCCGLRERAGAERARRDAV
jgi:HEAT repeat protein